MVNKCNDRIDVCILSTVHRPDDARVFQKEAISLVENGYAVNYWTPRTETRVDSGINLQRPSFADWTFYRLLPKPFQRIVAGVLLFFAVMRDQHYDVYHFHDPELLPGACIARWFTDAKLIYDAHEDTLQAITHKSWIPSTLIPPLKGVVIMLNRFATTQLDAVIVASKDIAQRYAFHENVIIITNYPRKAHAKEMPRRNTPKPVQLVYCGLLSESRGIRAMIEAVESVSTEHSVRFVVAGNCHNDELENYIYQKSISAESIEYKGWVDREDVMELYRRSDIGLFCFHPSAKNLVYGAHRSHKLFRYMAAGLPVVVSDIGNWPDIVEQFECGVTVTPEVKEISAVLSELIENPGLRESYGSNGRQAILQQFSWESQEHKLLELYGEFFDPNFCNETSTSS